MKIPYKEKFDPSEIPDGVIAIPFKYGPSYNGLINRLKHYTKEEYLDAVNSERMQELYSAGTLTVEFLPTQGFLTKGGDNIRFKTIDPANIVGYVYALDDNNLYIQKGHKFDSIIPKDCISYLKAYTRAIRGIKYSIITWDIIDSRLDSRIEQLVSLYEDFVETITIPATINKQTPDYEKVVKEFKNRIVDYFIQNCIYNYELVDKTLKEVNQNMKNRKEENVDGTNQCKFNISK